VAEYHLLNQSIEINGTEVVINMTNPIEEPLLMSIKTDLVGFIREKLGNYSIQVTGKLVMLDASQRIAYTNKEKFEALMVKNPLLRELKDRFSLDADY
jgi:DNA polymerase III subunit gamma/tau